MSLPHHILYLTYAFPPSPYVGARRHTGLCQALSSQVDRLSIWTGNPHPDVNFPVYSVQYLRHFDVPRFIKPKPGYSAAQGKPGKAVSWLIKLKNSIPFSIFLGLGGPWYVLQAYWKFNRIPKADKPDILITSFYPLSDLLAGYLIKRTHPQVRWVADFRDLPVDMAKNQVLWPQWTQLFFKHLLRFADQVTAVSGGLLTQLPIRPERSYVLYNGLEKEKIQENPNHPAEKFTISYTGSVYIGLQESRILWQVLDQLIKNGKMEAEKIEVHYAGPQSTLWRNWLSDYKTIPFYDHGYQTALAVRKLQFSSQINLLLTWSTRESKGIMTTKLFEYLAAQRPILALIKGEYDVEVANVIEQINGGKCFSTMDSALIHSLEKWILNAYDQWKKDGFLPSKSNSTNVAMYDWNHLIKEWLNP